jgi:hypothetical protein
MATGRAYSKPQKLKLFRAICELCENNSRLTKTSIADAISESRNISFDRQNLYRLASGKLGSEHVEVIVSWLEATHDGAIRDKLDMNKDVERFSYAHREFFPSGVAEPVLMELEARAATGQAQPQLLLRSPIKDHRSFYPASHINQNWDDFFEDDSMGVTLQHRLDRGSFANFLDARSLIFLQEVSQGVFFVRDIPLSSLYTGHITEGSQRASYMGVLHILGDRAFLDARDMLTRQRSSHMMRIYFYSDATVSSPLAKKRDYIKKISSYPSRQPSIESMPLDEVSRIYVPREFLQEIEGLSNQERCELLLSHKAQLESAFELRGAASYESAPLATLPSMFVSVDCIYVPKDEDLFLTPELTLPRAHLIDKRKLNRLYNFYKEENF